MSNIAIVLLVVVAAVTLPAPASSWRWPWSKKTAPKTFEEFEAETGLDQLRSPGESWRQKVTYIGSLDSARPRQRSGKYRRSEDDIEPLIVATKYNYHDDHDDDFRPDSPLRDVYREGEETVNPSEEFELPQPELNTRVDGVVDEDGIVEGVESLGGPIIGEDDPAPLRRKMEVVLV